MNRIKALFLAALTWGAISLNNTQAQVDVIVNPVNLLFGDINLGADIRVTDNFSLEPNIGYGSGSILGLEYKHTPATLFGKYYFSPKLGADRFYADAFARFVKRDYTVTSEESTLAEYDVTRFGMGIGVGYKVVSEKGFTFDFGLNVGRGLYDKKEIVTQGEEVDLSWSSTIYIVKVGMGYRFGGGKRNER